MDDQLIELAAQQEIINETWRTLRGLLVTELEFVRQNIQNIHLDRAMMQLDYIIDAIKP